MKGFQQEGNVLLWELKHEKLKIVPWGRDSLRLQASAGPGIQADLPGALVAPVTFEGARSREVYLPAGTAWKDAWTDQVYPGGQTITADAPLEKLPLYLRGEAELPIKGQERTA